MILNPKKWIKTLPSSRLKENQDDCDVDNNRWINTISQPKKDNSIIKYGVSITLFIFGLVFVSVIKNETRSLQKEINKLQASMNILNNDLQQATLDYEVITAPENIDKLVKEYLEIDLNPYKRSQIKHFNNFDKNLVDKKKIEKNKELNKNFKKKITNTINVKKDKIKEIQKILLKPDQIPKEIKNSFAKKIAKTKSDIKKLYKEPKNEETQKKMRSWAGLQIVKLMFGMPIIPGR